MFSSILPVEVIEEILLFLGLPGAFQARAVSKTWKENIDTIILSQFTKPLKLLDFLTSISKTKREKFLKCYGATLAKEYENLEQNKTTDLCLRLLRNQSSLISLLQEATKQNEIPEMIRLRISLLMNTLIYEEDLKNIRSFSFNW